jgi:hypothetical protein
MLTAAQSLIKKFILVMILVTISFTCFADTPPAPLAEGAEISYQLKKAMRVSINIYDEKGQIVRQLMNGAPRKAGTQKEIWDGRGQDGQPLPAGQYSWKILGMPGKLQTKFLLTAGTNYPDPEPDATHEQYREIAPGCHGGPAAVCADDTGIYIGASCTENIENYLIKLSPDGKKRFWSALQPVAWTGAAAMARSGDRLLVLANNHDIWNYQSSDGKWLGAWSCSLPAASDESKDKPDATRFTADFAANDKEAMVCFPARGIVRWLNPTSGALLAEVTGLDKPTAVAITADSTTYAICGNTVVKVDRTGKEHVVIVRDLVSPGKISVAKNGDLLVSVAGELKQIMRMSPDGKLIATYGIKGGRKDGKYDKTAQESFYDINDLTATADDGFLVAEPNCAPRRTGRFDAKGKIIQEWYGGQVWSPWIAVDPNNPSTVFMPSHWGWMMRLDVDYKTNSWKVRSIHQTNGMANGLVQGHANALLYRAIRHEGVLYLVGDQTRTVFKVDDKNDQLIPVMTAHPQMRHYFSTMPPIIKGWAAAGDQSYIWTDANGDGKPQREEMTFYPQGGPWTGLPMWFDGGIIASGMRWAITGWNKAGTPLLADYPAGKPFLKTPDRAKNIEGRWGSYYATDPKTGEWYAAYNANMPTWGTSKDSFLVAFDPQGNQRWITGGRTIGTPQSFLSPSDIGCFRRIAGLTHDCVVLNDFAEGPRPLTSYVWDRDGLWVGGLMDEIDRKACPAWRYGAGGEALGTTIHTDPKTGKVLLFWQGINDIRIGEVTGWDGWIRNNGTIKLTAASKPVAPVVTEVAPGTGTGLWLEAFAPNEKEPKTKRLTTGEESWGTGTGPDGLRLYNGNCVIVTGEIEALYTGWHTLSLPRMPYQKWSIDGHDFSHVSGNNTNDELYMEAGKRYPIQIYYNPGGTHPTVNHGIHLKWATPRGTMPGMMETIPVTQLYPTKPAEKVK